MNKLAVAKNTTVVTVKHHLATQNGKPRAYNITIQKGWIFTIIPNNTSDLPINPISRIIWASYAKKAGLQDVETTSKKTLPVSDSKSA